MLAAACIVAAYFMGEPRSFVIQPCVQPQYVSTMACAALQPLKMSTLRYVRCWDPTTKRVVYNDKAFLVEET
jgi:hypothetical protein